MARLNKSLNTKVAVMGGVAQSLANFRGDLIKEMIKAGCIVYAIAPDFSEKTSQLIRSIGAIPVKRGFDRGGLNPVRDIVDFLCLVKTLIEIRVDLFVGYTVKPATFGTIAACMSNVKRRYTIITGLGNTFLGSNYKQQLIGKLVTVLYRLSLRLTHGVFFQNDDDLKLFVQRNIIGHTPLHVVNGSGVNLSKYTVLPVKVFPFIFMMVSRLYREKGIYEFIEAARIVRRQYASVEFHIVGEPDLYHDAPDTNQIQQWVSEGLIVYHGWLDDIRSVLADATVVVLPSYREGTPRSLLEAIAMGKPVITTDSPGCRETVIPGKSGWLVPVKDHEMLAIAMIQAVEAKHRLQAFGLEGRRLAEERFDVCAVNREIMRCIGFKV